MCTALSWEQQVNPDQAAEAALRALLRFLFTDRGIALRFPSEELPIESATEPELSTILISFSDASHAAYRFLNRRGITGGALMFYGTLIKAFARIQTSVALSSCESELFALQSVAQESVSVAKLIYRIMFGLVLQDEQEMIYVFIALCRIYPYVDYRI